LGEKPNPTVPEEQSEKGGTHLEETPTIESFFKAHCTKCHNAEKKKGGINFLKLTDFRLENTKHWQEALDNLQRGDMPPKESIQPSIANRKTFVAKVLKELDPVYADSDKRNFRFSRLTNSQIARTLRDLLQIDRDFSGDLIEDPAGKHGESLKSELELTAGHMEVYLSALQKAIDLAVPDWDKPPKPYVRHGNDWEKQHYLNRNDLAHGNRRHHPPYTYSTTVSTIWRYDSGDIGCIDVKTGKSTLVEAPIQLLADKMVWNKVDFQFTREIRNSRDLGVNKRVGSVRGIQRGGFGHTSPAYPVRHEDKLYWQGGAGVLYVIDLTKPFSPDALSWLATDPVGASWTFGEPAIDKSGIYVRSQRDLVRITP
jgi:hypothetical protein